MSDLGCTGLSRCSRPKRPAGDKKRWPGPRCVPNKSTDRLKPVLLKPRFFARRDDLWGRQSCLQPAFEPAPPWTCNPDQPAGKPAAATIGCPTVSQSSIAVTKWSFSSRAGRLTIGRRLTTCPTLRRSGTEVEKICDIGYECRHHVWVTAGSGVRLTRRGGSWVSSVFAAPRMVRKRVGSRRNRMRRRREWQEGTRWRPRRR
jgi:hypothetical protein